MKNEVPHKEKLYKTGFGMYKDYNQNHSLAIWKLAKKIIFIRHIIKTIALMWTIETRQTRLHQPRYSRQR